MASSNTSVIEERVHLLHTRWSNYISGGSFDQFIEFAVTVNSLAEHFSRMRLPGLVRLCEGLENLALARLGSQASHPLPAQDIALLQRQVSTLLGTVATSRSAPPERRIEEYRDEPRPVEWIKPRLVWLRKRRTSY